MHVSPPFSHFQNGGNLYDTCIFQGETPVVHIASDILEEFLDDCIQGEGQSTDANFKITFRWS